jgi:hypothetical protein
LKPDLVEFVASIGTLEVRGMTRMPEPVAVVPPGPVRLRPVRLSSTAVKEHLADPQRSGQPHGTLSQIVIYIDASDLQVALVHQYLRPDGTLGGSGRPDPKKVLTDGVLYILELGS